MDSTSTTRSVSSTTLPQQSSKPDRQSERTGNDLLARLYGPVLDPMAQMEQRLGRELQSQYESVAQVLRHGTQLGGKRLRPALLCLAGSAIGELSEEHVVLGTVIEMVHTATLVHDDVLDEARTRRHVSTVNARWNNHTSILLGDYLFAQSYRLAATLSSTVACQWIGEAARLVCEGELRQVLQRDELELDEETYTDIIRCKTAELCRVACALGARYSGGDESAIEALGRYGNAVGIAFQIADDYLDLWGSDETVGKTLGTDIEQGKMTLPLIRLLSTASQCDRKNISNILRGPAAERVDRIRPYLERSDARAYTQQVADSYRNTAVETIEFLDANPAKASLTAIAHFSVDRKF